MYIYSIFGSENFSIRARSRFLAEEPIYAMSTDDLVVYADIGGSIEVVDIENY